MAATPDSTSTRHEPPAPIGLPSDSRSPATLGGRQTAEYEQYFRIRRADPGLLGWTRSVLAAQSSFLDDLPHTGLTDRERADLLAGMLLLNGTALTGWSAAPDGRPAEAGAEPAPAGTDEERATALRRWKVGHQLFHLHLAAMNTALDTALDALRKDRLPQLLRALNELCVLYDAATATMAYAADFSPAAYQDHVRPTMEPPFVGPGFSGVFNQDHRVMVDLMHTLRRAVRSLEPDGGVIDEVRAAAARLRAAQNRNRAGHAHVCERFVPDGTSLLREHLEAEDARTAGPPDRREP